MGDEDDDDDDDDNNASTYKVQEKNLRNDHVTWLLLLSHIFLQFANCFTSHHHYTSFNAFVCFSANNLCNKPRAYHIVLNTHVDRLRIYTHLMILSSWE